MLHEISRRFIHLSKHEEPSLYWHNSVLCVQANKHLTFFDFSYNLHSLEKKIDLKENAVKYPSNSPVSTQFLQNYLQKGVKNIELMEMITNPSFWPHSKLLKTEMENIKSLKCSPDNFINHCENLVAVVNNFGNVNFLAPSRCVYTNQLDFTTYIKNYIQLPECLKKSPNDINTVKEIVYKTCTNAICWAPQKSDDNSCHFVTVQKSGHILFWSIRTELNDITSEFCGSFKSNIAAEIEAIIWIPLAYNRILLISSNNLGQVIKYDCTLDNKHFKLINEDYIWEYKDRMVAKFLHFYKCDDKIILLYNKNRHVIIQLLDEQLNLLSQNNLPVNDQKIISIVNFKNVFYLGTMNTKLYKLNVIIEKNDLKVSLESIEIKENFQTYELYGIGISQNNAMFALALKDRKLLHRKEALKIDIVFFSTDNSPNNELYKIINNRSQSFTAIWDYIELLRCKVIRNKNIPEFDYNNLLLESNTNLYKLKVYFVILMFYVTLRKSKTVTLLNMPNTSDEQIKERILMTQAVKLLNSLNIEYQKDKQLNSFQSECFVGAKTFLAYYCNKYKKCISELINQKTLDVCNSNAEYICQSCENKLDGFTCTHNIEHFNMFCSLTFTPIESNNYLVCKGCGMTAREELYDDMPTCLFCDMHLIHYDMII